MAQDIEIFMEDCVVMGSKIYFFSKDWNALYVADFVTKETKLVSTMPEEKIYARRLCAGIVYYNKKLILLPMTAEKIWVFDLESNQWKGIERRNLGCGDDSQKEIFRAIIYRKNLFLIGSNYPAIIRMDMLTYELEYLTEPYTFLSSLKTADQCYFRSDFCINENYLLMASCLNNYVLQVDLNSFSYKWHEVGEKGFCYSGIAWDGEYYWLSPRRGTPIVRWKMNGETKYIPLPNEFKNKIYNFLGVQYNNGNLVFPGMQQNKTIIIKAHGHQEINVREGRYVFYRCFEKNNVVLQQTNGLVCLQYTTLDKRYDMYCKIRRRELIEYLKNNLENNESIIDIVRSENMIVSLTLFLSFVIKKRKYESKKYDVGVKIWKDIRN